MILPPDKEGFKILLMHREKTNLIKISLVRVVMITFQTHQLYYQNTLQIPSKIYYQRKVKDEIRSVGSSGTNLISFISTAYPTILVLYCNGSLESFSFCVFVPSLHRCIQKHCKHLRLNFWLFLKLLLYQKLSDKQVNCNKKCPFRLVENEGWG